MKRLAFFIVFAWPFITGAQISEPPQKESINDSLETTLRVDSLLKVGRDFIGKRNYPKAQDLLTMAEKIAVDRFGRESVSFSNCIQLSGRLNEVQRNFNDAEKKYLEVISIRKRVLGKVHPQVATMLNGLGGLYRTWSQYEKAEPLYLEALTIWEKTTGKEHRDYAVGLNNLGVLYLFKSQYEKAEPLILQAKQIREKVFGKESLEYASSTMSLGVLYRDMGEYEKAEPLQQEALLIRKKLLGENSPEYAESLNNLGSLYYFLGNYEKAESLWHESLAIREKTVGKEHPNYTSVLGNIGALYLAIGDYDKAEKTFIETIKINEKVAGKEDPDYAMGLVNLAGLYSTLNRYDQALQLLFEAKSIWEKGVGKEQPDYVNCLHNLGSVYKEMDSLEKAEQFYLEAHFIEEKIFDKSNSEYVKGPINLATLYRKMGKYEKAEALLLEAKTILEQTVGKEKFVYALCLHNLARTYSDLGQHNKAEPLFLETNSIARKLVSHANRHLSEREMDNYLKSFSEQQFQLLSFVQYSGNVNAIPVCYDNSLFYKGYLLQAANKIKQLSIADTTSVEKLNRLKSIHRRLSKLYAAPLTTRDSSAITQLESEANTVEKELTKTVAGYADATRQVNWQDVQSALKPGEAAIEFVNFQTDFQNQTDSTMYAALLILPGVAKPKFIPLFKEKQLIQLLNQTQNSNSIATVYASRGVKPLQTGTQMSGLLELIWEPIVVHLSDVKTVYYSPSGLLYRLNFNAIPIDKGLILSDKYRLVELGTTRSLVLHDSKKRDIFNTAVLYGGIHYQMDPMMLARDSISHIQLDSQFTELSFVFDDQGLPHRGDNWNYLPGTKNEVDHINMQLKKAKFSSKVLSGYDATEETFKSLGQGNKSPRILHIATHGYFFPDLKVEPNKNKTTEREPIFKISEHPMMRSGLILAGGNFTWKTGKPLYEGMEDGILTAYEISQINLDNTELVVLSACETGLGDIQGNEGVYGLQRAFKIAGVKYIIMSLWQVPDKQTSQLMITFYKKWLENKLSIPDAFHAAQKELREAEMDPNQWAGFVLIE